MNVRVIARLDIKGPNLVKGIHFEGLRVLGKPEDYARYYYESGADELLYMDAVASLYGRNSLLDIVERTSREIFIPLTVGGGLRTVEDVRTVLRAGADKVSLNTAAIKRPELIRECANSFGSSTIVVSIEAIRQPNGSYECFTDYGRESSGVDAYQWAQQAVELGAGELIITSIDREGTGKGFDLELTRRMAELVSVPVIASGGAGKVEHVAEALTEGYADSVSLASLLHYNLLGRKDYHDSSFKAEGNIEFLQGRRGERAFSNINPATIPEIKDAIRAQGFGCRYSLTEK